jgi:hypothetical protein
MMTTIIRWFSIPVLLIASLFSNYAASYEFSMSLAVCLGAIVVVTNSARSEKYFRAAGFVVVALLFSPFVLVAKIFLLMGLACAAVFATLLTSFGSSTRRRDPCHSDFTY